MAVFAVVKMDDSGTDSPPINSISAQVKVANTPLPGARTAQPHFQRSGIDQQIVDEPAAVCGGAKPHATGLITEFVAGRHLESTAEEVDRTMHPHPNLSKTVAGAALAALGHPLHM